jgi:hypothetical protein
MKLVALFLMLSLFVVSAFGRQDQNPTSMTLEDAAGEETPYDDEEDYEEDAEDAAEGQTNRDLGWYDDGYSRGYSRGYRSYNNDDNSYSYNYGYRYSRPRVVHRRYHNYYRGGKGKGGMGMGYRS